MLKILLQCDWRTMETSSNYYHYNNQINFEYPKIIDTRSWIRLCINCTFFSRLLRGSHILYKIIKFTLKSCFIDFLLQNLFSQIRRKNCDPGVKEFLYCLKSIIISQYLRDVKTSCKYLCRIYEKKTIIQRYGTAGNDFLKKPKL